MEKAISIICVLLCAETGALLTIRTPQKPHGSDDWFHADLRGSLAKADGQYRYVQFFANGLFVVNMERMIL